MVKFQKFVLSKIDFLLIFKASNCNSPHSPGVQKTLCVKKSICEFSLRLQVNIALTCQFSQFPRKRFWDVTKMSFPLLRNINTRKPLKVLFSFGYSSVDLLQMGLCFQIPTQQRKVSEIEIKKDILSSDPKRNDTCYWIDSELQNSS